MTGTAICLVTGACGQVGRSLVEALPEAGLGGTFLSHEDLDVSDWRSVCECVSSVRPDLLINAAAYTNVDKAESEREVAFAVNAAGPGHLAAVAEDLDIPLLHVSTDYVFDGQSVEPYRPRDPIAPMGAYGKSKAAGEALVREKSRRHIVLRTAWVFSPFGRNFVKTMLTLGREREELRVVADQVGCPTGARDIATALASLARAWVDIGELSWGTYHFVCQGRTSWHGLAEATFDIAAPAWGGHRPRVVPISTEEYPTLAKRPAYSVLDCETFDATFGTPRRDWKLSLAETVHHLVS